MRRVVKALWLRSDGLAHRFWFRCNGLIRLLLSFHCCQRIRNRSIPFRACCQPPTRWNSLQPVLLRRRETELHVSIKAARPLRHLKSCFNGYFFRLLNLLISKAASIRQRSLRVSDRWPGCSSRVDRWFRRKAQRLFFRRPIQCTASVRCECCNP